MPDALPLTLRPATDADLAAINAIYNHYVAHSAALYQDEPWTDAERRAWFDGHGPRHPVTVAIDGGGAVVGWGSLSPFSARTGYRFTVENSVYVRPEFHGRGVGGALLADLLDRAAALGHHSVIALIDSGAAASLRLHERFGFAPAGRLTEAGLKFGRWLDVLYLQKRLGGRNFQPNFPVVATATGAIR